MSSNFVPLDECVRTLYIGGPMATPSSGLIRRYKCSALLGGGKFLLCGTDVGDMVVFG